MVSVKELCIFDKSEWDLLAEELALSPRQNQIIYFLLNGKSDKQIAQEMGLALPTVRTHLSRLFTKFDVQDRTSLILRVFYHFRTASKLTGRQ